MYITLKEEIKDASKDLFYFISVAKASSEKILFFLSELDSRGIRYFLSLKCEENLNNPVYLKLCEENIKRASVAIMILDDVMICTPEFLNLTMYECGIVTASAKKIYLVDNGISAKAMNEIFVQLPINSMQLSNFTDVVATIDKYRTLPKNLFEKREINEYANGRIFYIRMIVMMDIRFGSLKKIYDRFSGYGDVTMKDILDELEQDISTGLTFMHFEKEERRNHVCLWAYRDETVTVCRDFPVRNAFNKIKVFNSSFQNKSKDTDVVATLKMEFILPNNEMLGTTFKPFLQIDDNTIMSNDLINMLLDDGVSMDTIKVVKVGGVVRVYYPLNLGNHNMECDINDELSLKYGKTANYVFPK